MTKTDDDEMLAGLALGNAKPRTKAEELVRKALRKDPGSDAREKLLEQAMELGSGEAFLTLGFDAWSPPLTEDDPDPDADQDDDLFAEPEQDERDRARAVGLFKGAVRAGCDYGWGALAMTFASAGEHEQAKELWKRWLGALAEAGESGKDGIETPMFLFYLSDSPYLGELLADAAPFDAVEETLAAIDERIERMDESAEASKQPMMKDDLWIYDQLAEERGTTATALIAADLAERAPGAERDRAEAARLRQVATWLRSVRPAGDR